MWKLHLLHYITFYLHFIFLKRPKQKLSSCMISAISTWYLNVVIIFDYYYYYLITFFFFFFRWRVSVMFTNSCVSRKLWYPWLFPTISGQVWRRNSNVTSTKRTRCRCLTSMRERLILPNQLPPTWANSPTPKATCTNATTFSQVPHPSLLPAAPIAHAHPIHLYIRLCFFFFFFD